MPATLPRTLGALFIAAGALAPLPATAVATLTSLNFEVFGSESVPGASGYVTQPALDTTGNVPHGNNDYSQIGYCGSETAGSRDETCAQTIRFESLTAWVESRPYASVSGTQLKTRAHVEGAAAPVITQPLRTVQMPWGEIILGRQQDANWSYFDFSSTAEARLYDEVVVTHPSASLGSFRMVFEIDGEDTAYVNTFDPGMGAINGWTGGGYVVPFYAMLTDFYFGVWPDPNAETLVYQSAYEGLPQGLNPVVPETVMPRRQTVLSPSVPIGATSSYPIHLRMVSDTFVKLENLDSGHVLFLMESDFSHTADIVGFEVFDTQGNLVPDALVRSTDGTVYRTLGSVGTVPEPGSPALVAGALLGVGVLRRRPKRRC